MKTPEKQITEYMESLLNIIPVTDWKIVEDSFFKRKIALEANPNISITYLECPTMPTMRFICQLNVGWWNFRRIKKKFNKVFEYYSEQRQKKNRAEFEKKRDESIEILEKTLKENIRKYPKYDGLSY
jgi:hypothetical protein